MSLGLIRALLITDPLIILSTIIFGSVSLVASLFDPSGSRQVRIARYWSQSLLILAGVRVKIEGLENISPDASYVFSANHLSFMDTPVVLANIPVQFRFLAKKGLFKIPFLGYHLGRAGHIPVPRDDPRGAVRTMLRAADLIRERGISIFIFSEGGRSEDGELKSFKEGTAYIAIRAGVPVIPVALEGTHAVLPMHSLNIRPGTIRLWIGEPIATRDLTMRDRERLTAQVRNGVAALLEQHPSKQAHAETEGGSHGNRQSAGYGAEEPAAH